MYSYAQIEKKIEQLVNLILIVFKNNETQAK